MLLLENLTVCVEQQVIIKNFSLHIKDGSIHVIMGKNGSGKSSLAYTLIGLPTYQVAKGIMKFKNVNFADLSIHERSKAGIFLAFQQPVAIPGVTVFQFLKEIFTARGYQASPQEFQELVHQYFNQVGLDFSFLYRSLHENFSGGEKKRLEVVQMLLLKPSLIILDEIDSGLDVDALRAVGQAVTTYLVEHRQASCLIITHYRRILEYIQPDFVHIMHEGTIVHSGDVQVAHNVELHGYDVYGS